MKNAQPLLNTPPFTWPMIFEGTVDGKRAVAIINDTCKTQVWKLRELGMPESCFDLLDEKSYFETVQLPGEDAALIVGQP